MATTAVEVEKHIEDVKKDELRDESTENEFALSELERIKKRFDKTKATIEIYKNYEKVLEVEKKTDIECVNQFEKAFLFRYTIWNNRIEFKQLKKKWFGEELKTQDSDKILEEVKRYNAINNRLRNELAKDEKDEVLEALTREVLEVKDQSRLIQALGNKALTAEHWGLILEKLG